MIKGLESYFKGDKNDKGNKGQSDRDNTNNGRDNSDRESAEELAVNYKLDPNDYELL